MEPGIFVRPRQKKSLLPPPSKKRKVEHKIEEINFDSNARSDYLTGFHKRKVQRAKQAQEEAAKKAREERIVMRKQLREERKQELAEHVDAVQALLRDGNPSDENSENEGWAGIQDEEAAVEIVDHEEAYVDEDRYTTVTVEAVDVSKEGLHKIMEEEQSDDTMDGGIHAGETVEKDPSGKKKWPKKPKKKKFRYESKVERKVTRAKQKAGRKSKADARRGDER